MVSGVSHCTKFEAYFPYFNSERRRLQSYAKRYYCPDIRLRTIKAYFWQILEGLLYIHKDLNIFYGNLKCSDVIITNEGGVKIGSSPQLKTHYTCC
jgi:serine/threonine protein kinase